jgi:hypothetical protein
VRTDELDKMRMMAVTIGGTPAYALPSCRKWQIGQFRGCADGDAGWAAFQCGKCCYETLGAFVEFREPSLTADFGPKQCGKSVWLVRTERAWIHVLDFRVDLQSLSESFIFTCVECGMARMDCTNTDNKYSLYPEPCHIQIAHLLEGL